MKATELREMNLDELDLKNQELNKELFNLRFQMHTGHLENTSRLSQVRKDIARIKTIMVEKKV
ncbi:MAG: 50S ribosomal protein L29 [Geoalkalibacter sp.]|uniref:50S ribosomal protein L29 n=1 Tax=Geoalkalibacter sp. TaxID=3041440 RepID=UPI003D0FEF53